MTIKKTTLRLGIALSGTVSLFALATPAYADCAVATTTNANDTVNCTATVTTNTTAATSPTTSREIQFTSPANTFANITGPITGYGLALTQVDTATKLLTVNNTSSITVNAGNAPTAGSGNGALRITSYGDNVTYLGSGTISNLGIGDGLQVEASGSATPVALNINAGGAITATTGFGVRLNNTAAGSTTNATFTSVTNSGLGQTGIDSGTSTGAQTINSGVVNSGGTGLFAYSTSGAITANVTGNVTSNSGATGQGVGLFSTGSATQIVNVTGGNVTNVGGVAIETSSLGAQTVNVSAGRTVSGATGVNVYLTGGTLAVNNSGTITATTAAINSPVRATITNNAGGTINGALQLSAFADTVNNAGTLALTGASSLGDGADTVTNSGTLSLAAGSSVDFGAGADSFVNSGITNVSGATTLANLESFSNTSTGTVNFAAGSSLTSSASTSFTNLGRFNVEAGPVGIITPNFTNGATGVIDMQDGVIGDVTTITGNYAGVAGSKLLIDANADLSGSDRLVITGNITGASQLSVGYLGTAATFNPTGTLVVDGGGTTAAGSFVLDPATTNNGLLTYSLDLRGADYYLRSNFNAGVTGLAPLARMGSDLWYQSFDAYHDGIAGRHGYRENQVSPIGVWANLYVSRDKWGESSTTSTLFGQTLTYSSEVENKRRGAQGGIDIGVGGFTVGITGGYEKNRATNGTAANYTLEGYNYGAYALFGSEAGIYGGVMYKRDDFDVAYLDNSRGFGLNINGAHSNGWDGELGFRTTGDTIKFDLNGGVSWVKTKIDPVTLYGSTFSYDGAESMRGRLGARMIFPQALGAFVGVKVFHEFKDDNEGLLITSGSNSGTLLPEPRGTTFRAEAGLGGDAKGGPVVTVWGDFGDSTGLGVRAGFRF